MPAALIPIAASVAGAYAASAVGAYVGAEFAASEFGSELILSGAVTGSQIALGSTLIGAAAGTAINFAVQRFLGGSGKATNPSTQAAARGALINAASSYAGIPVPYGARRVGGVRILTEVTGASNEFLHLIFVWGEGQINAVAQLYLDDTAISDGTYSGLTQSVSYVGTDGQAADATAIANLAGKWTASDTCSGLAYSYVRLTWSDSAFPRGMPTVTADLQGKLVYDPRDSTTKYSNNPALCLREYLTNTRYGLKAPSAMIDDTAFQAAANDCDASMTIPTGGGTTTQVKYTCDGLLDIDQTRLDNIRQLLSTCRGYLVYSGGQYKLKTDKLTTPSSFTLSESNIVGGWSIQLPQKRSRANRVRASFIDGANLWQPNVVAVSSSAYAAADGATIEQQLDLPLVVDVYRAQAIAQQALTQTRFGIAVQLTATIAAMQLEVGDVVPVTHTTPGWTAKPFRVVGTKLLSTDEVQLQLAEYDDTVYTTPVGSYVTPSAATNLPNPTSVAMPGLPSVTESKYVTTGSAGVKSKATVSWAASMDQFVVNGGRYQLEYQRSGASGWSIAALVQSSITSVDVFDLAPGTYNFRVKALNGLGISSSYATTNSITLYGLNTAPSDVTGFGVVASQGMARCFWNLPTATNDLDVRIGGRLELRWSPLTSGATWQDGIILDAFNGDLAAGVTDLMTGTYLAKFKTSSGVYSANAVSYVATEGMVTGFNTVLTRTEDPTFSGTKSNVAVVAGVLKLDSVNTISTQPGNVSTWPKISSLGGITTGGNYDFGYDDLTTVAVRRWQGTVKALSFDTGDTIAQRTNNISTWNSIVGSTINDCDATLEISTTNDDPAGAPTWGPYTPFFVGDFSCRAARYRLLLASAAPTHNIQISQLRISAKTPVSP